MNRPQPLARLPSFTKRHASFDSPREVPLQSPLSPRDARDLGGKLGYFDLPDERERVDRDKREELRKEHREREQQDEKPYKPSLHSPHHSRESNHHHNSHHSLDKTSSSLHNPCHLLHSPQPFHFEPNFKSSLESEPNQSTGEPPQPIFPHPRPYSLPYSSNSGSGSSGSGHPSPGGASGVGISGVHTFGGQSITGAIGSQRETTGQSKVDGYAPGPYLGISTISGNPDRSSSASLPLPAQIPYHTLPKVQFSSRMSDGQVSENGCSSGGSSESPTSVGSSSNNEYPFFRDPPPRSPNLPSSPRTSNSNCYSTPHSRPSTSPDITSTLPLPYLAEDESSASYMTAMRRSIKPPLTHPPIILEESSPSSSNLGRSASTGSSTAHAHMIQTPSQSNNSQGSGDDTRTEVWRNPPPVQPPRAHSSPRPIGGFMNPLDLPPVLPPQRTMGGVGHGSATPSLMNNSLSAPPSTNTSLSLPHTPPNPHSTRQGSFLISNNPPAYAPFLSPLPPPPERCWIEVETMPTAYKLNVRLEGFKRDGITLATRRRRVLHVVADSWDAGGGHFERRISFGYDADLMGVRAEFDGEWLRIVVPKRAGAF